MSQTLAFAVSAAVAAEAAQTSCYFAGSFGPTYPVVQIEGPTLAKNQEQKKEKRDPDL